MLQVGTQVILNNGLWAIVEEIYPDTGEAFAVDKDGQDYCVELDGSDVYHIYKD